MHRPFQKHTFELLRQDEANREQRSKEAYVVKLERTNRGLKGWATRLEKLLIKTIK